MDNLAHSLAGLTLAKAGLERLSPAATIVCVLAANAPDIDIVSGLDGRWSLLRNHRGITHSILGTLVLAILIPTIFWLVDRAIGKLRRRNARIRHAGLLLASVIAAATHPLMDWTNNYGVRLLLPWSGKWFYGDLLFIVDPYFWLVMGGAAFLLTSDRIAKLVIWAVLATGVTLLLLFALAQRSVGYSGAMRAVWLGGIAVLVISRRLRLGTRLGSTLAWGALVTIVFYCSGVAWLHREAYAQATAIGARVASGRSERLVQAAAMPTPGNPFLWQCVVETEAAMYRFSVGVGGWLGNRASANATDREIQRFAKPVGEEQELVSEAARDPRAQILLGFARFPLARARDPNCVGETVVQFADLRFTEPGRAGRSAFSLEVPAACSEGK